MNFPKSPLVELIAPHQRQQYGPLFAASAAAAARPRERLGPDTPASSRVTCFSYYAARAQPPAAASVPLPRPRALRAAVVAVAAASGGGGGLVVAAASVVVVAAAAAVVVVPAVVAVARAVAGMAAVWCGSGGGGGGSTGGLVVRCGGGADGYPRPCVGKILRT